MDVTEEAEVTKAPDTVKKIVIRGILLHGDVIRVF